MIPNGLPSASSRYDVIIIGAGAAGLMCAAGCGRRRRSVLMLDHGKRTAAKVRISGGGRCNFTNLQMGPDHYHSQNPDFVRSALARFTPRDMLDLVERHHISWYEKEAGQLFCRRSSLEIVGLLERECREAGAEVRLACPVRSVSRPDGFLVATEAGGFLASSLVVATGGLSYPGLGASPFGHDLARQFGISVVPARPALVPFLFAAREQKRFGQLAGISLDASLQAGKKQYRGSILFTHRGLSGPAALQASLRWERGDRLLIDLLPAADIGAILRARRKSRVQTGTVLGEFLPKRFVAAWLEEAAASRPLDQTSDRDLRKIAERLHAWEVAPKGTEAFDAAEATAGGVDTDELSSKTMEAKKVPGLYFIGEVVDVTGELGGYNLHWAWASGHAAGQYA